MQRAGMTGIGGRLGKTVFEIVLGLVQQLLRLVKCLLVYEGLKLAKCFQERDGDDRHALNTP
jgi:hypothetical protein